MVTFTTYGTWLQGDDRGYVKDGEILKGNKALFDSNRRAMKGKSIRFNGRAKEIVRQAILNEAQEMNQKVFAILVWSNHVHVAAGNIDESIGKVVGRYKAAATKALRGAGFTDKVWTKGYNTRFCYDENALRRRIAYVEGHTEKNFPQF